MPPTTHSLCLHSPSLSVTTNYKEVGHGILSLPLITFLSRHLPLRWMRPRHHFCKHAASVAGGACSPTCLCTCLPYPTPTPHTHTLPAYLLPADNALPHHCHSLLGWEDLTLRAPIPLLAWLHSKLPWHASRTLLLNSPRGTAGQGLPPDALFEHARALLILVSACPYLASPTSSWMRRGVQVPNYTSGGHVKLMPLVLRHLFIILSIGSFKKGIYPLPTPTHTLIYTFCVFDFVHLDINTPLQALPHTYICPTPHMILGCRARRRAVAGSAHGVLSRQTRAVAFCTRINISFQFQRV